MTERIFHVSEDPNITLFAPRPVPSPDSGVSGNAVFAIGDSRLHNYLLPRDCPRVTFYPGPNTDLKDIDHLFNSKCGFVVTIERDWLLRVKECTLYLYELPVDNFKLIDAGAAYYIARSMVAPIAVTSLRDLPSIIAERNVELRAEENLWALHDAVAASTLEFSMIRMRNAAPRGAVSSPD